MTEKKSIIAFIVGAIVGATIASQVLLLTWARQYRGEVYTIPMAPNGEYKVTAHGGRVYRLSSAVADFGHPLERLVI